MTAVVIEAFTRVYLSKHWFTDAAFALPLGVLLMLTNVAAVAAMAYRPTTDHGPQAARQPGQQSESVDVAVTD